MSSMFQKLTDGCGGNVVQGEDDEQRRPAKRARHCATNVVQKKTATETTNEEATDTRIGRCCCLYFKSNATVQDPWR